MSTPTPEYYLKRIPLSEKDKENGYVTVDPYRIARLWELKDPALFQAFKKTLCGGQRGGKDLLQDVKEARDALNRWLELEESVSSDPSEFAFLPKSIVARKTGSGWEIIYLTRQDTWDSVPWNPYTEGMQPISEENARLLVENSGNKWAPKEPKWMYWRRHENPMILRMSPEGSFYGKSLIHEEEMKNWFSIERPDDLKAFRPISEAKARVLVEKAGGVW